MQKRSMITSGIILLCVANLIWDFADLYYSALHFREETSQRAADQVAIQIDSLQKITDPVLLRQNLELLQQQERISFYIIKPERGVASVSLPDLVHPDFQAIVDGGVRLIFAPDNGPPQAAYAGEKIGKDEVVIGKMIDTRELENIISYNYRNFWRNFLVQALILMLIISYSFRELKTLLQNMQWGRLGLAGGGTENAFRFQETNSIASALGQVSKLQMRGQEDLDRLRAQIMPAAQNELLLKLEPPYEFPCVMVRVDINNSTAVYSDKNLIEVQRHWFDYFKVHCGEIAGRYQGFVHDELGDEVILYFKIHSGADLSTTASFALASVRDIFSLAAGIDLEIQKKFNFLFRVKASVDQGDLRVFRSSFVQNSQAGRLKIEGAGGESRNPFLTTVRMLKFFEDKTVNSCIVSDQIFQSAKPLIESSQSVNRSVPNIQDQQIYHLVTSFAPWTGQTKTSRFFLADEILIKHLETTTSQDIDLSEKLERINLVRAVSMGEASAPLQESMLKNFKAALSVEGDKDVKVLASLAALAPQIISSPSALDQVRDLLLSCLKFPNERVQANAIEAWGELDFKMDQVKKTLKVFRHNRTLANGIIATLKSEMDKPTLLLLSKMLNHKDVFMRAAGCFAVGEVAAHYRNANAIILESNQILQKQILRVSELALDHDEMVRRQALAAKTKISS